MKKSSIIVFVAVFCFLLLPLPEMAMAIDWSVEPYVKAGGLNFVEKGASEGNKFILIGGVKLNGVSGDFSGTLDFWKGQVAEGLDEDREIPNRFYGIGAEAAYKLVTYKGVVFSPYAGLGYENWSRETANPKICGSWDETGFFTGTLGVKANYKSVHAGVGVLYPFAIDANHHSNLDPRFGYQAEIGANIWKGLNTALQYRSLRMGNPQTRINTTTLMVGYRIPL